MEDFKSALKKYWIIGLAVLIIFASFVYFVKIAFDEKWISAIMIIISGLVLGLSCIAIGYGLYKKQLLILSEIFAGFGCGVTYATIAYAGFGEIWDTYTVFVSLIALTSVISWINYSFNLRVLTIISFTAALFTPFVIRASEFNILILVAYVVIIDIAMLLFTVLKKWRELPVVSMLLTFMLYVSYYIYITHAAWIEPFGYIFVIFIIFMSGLIFLTKADGRDFDGLNLYLSFINAVWFVLWAVYIFKAYDLNTAIPSLIVGLFFLLASLIIHLSFPKSKVAVFVYFLSGLFLIAVSGSSLGKMIDIRGMSNVVRASVWLFVIFTIYLTGIKFNHKVFVNIGKFGWIFVFFYWYIFAWNNGLVKWFGVDFIPFINPAGLLWMVLCATGFYISVTYDKYAQKSIDEKQQAQVNIEVSDVNKPPKNHVFIPVIIALLSHIAVGGLLTIQIREFWRVYNISGLDVGIIYSISWAIYAFILFVYGMLNNKKFFIYFADIVIVIVALKVIFYDISGEGSLYKVLTTFITGGLILGVGLLNYKYQNKNE